VSTATDLESSFLADLPTEIGDVLNWFNLGQARGVPPSHLTEFAGKFLGVMRDDGAVFPEITADSATHTLGSFA
jgi:hypothetical protein